MTPTRRNNAIPILIAALAAIAVQPLVTAAWLFRWGIDAGDLPKLDELAALSMIVCIVAAPFVALVGIPSALLLRHHPRRGWWLAAVGFMAAALPIAVLSTPQVSSASDLGLTLIFGMHGLVGGWAFHITWFQPECSSRLPMPPPRDIENHRGAHHRR